jgi:hypothetical protein
MAKNIMSRAKFDDPEMFKIPLPPDSCTSCGCDVSGKDKSICLLALVNSITGQRKIKPSMAFGCQRHYDREGKLLGLTPPLNMEFDSWLNHCYKCHDSMVVDKYAKQKLELMAKEGMSRIPGETMNHYGKRSREWFFANAKKIGAKI